MGQPCAAGDRLRIAVIGTGGFAAACHLPGLQSHSAAEVVLLCGRSEARRRELAEQWRVPETTGDYREAVARSDIDALTITTPNLSHCEIALAALAHGKHVFCEKPLGMNLAEAEVMAEAARQRGVVHQVAFTYRYLHSTAALRRRLREGAIGRPFFARLSVEQWSDLRPDALVGWRHQRALAGGGMLADVGSHYFDLINWTLGPLVEVSALLLTVDRTGPDRDGRTVRVDSDDLACVWFRTQSGLPGELCASRVTPAHGDNGFFEVVGEEGALMVILSRGSRDRLVLRRPNGAEEDLALPAEARSGDSYALGRMMRHFVESLQRGSSDPQIDATFDAGLAAQRVQDAALSSAAARCWQPVLKGEPPATTEREEPQ